MKREVPKRHQTHVKDDSELTIKWTRCEIKVQFYTKVLNTYM